MKKLITSICMLVITSTFAQVNHLVISQVYGGGGNTGAPYKNDFIELFNPTGSSVVIDGWSVQYASATGTFNAAGVISGTVAAGGYYLVQCAGGATGSALPVADATCTINLSGTAGKVLLAQTTTTLGATCTGISINTNTLIVDFVGYGTTASCYEGTNSTFAPSNTTSVSRISPCVDTDDNRNDFVAGAPVPHNSTSTTSITAASYSVTPYASISYTFTSSLASTFSVTNGSLPVGLTLGSSTGIISGSTSAVGTSTVEITAYNCAGIASSPGVFTITINANNPVSFVNGVSQTTSVCENSSANISLLFAINDADAGQTETYSLTAAPANGTVTIGTSQTSNGGTVTPATGFSYTPNASFNGTDIFSIQVDDGSGTPAVTTITVTVDAAPMLAANSATACAGVAATLSVSGANTFTWSPSANLSSANGMSVTATETVTTTYTIAGTDGNGCVNTTTTTLNINDLPNVQAVSSATAICVGTETVTLTASGADTYTWSANANSATTSATDVTPSSTDTYTVTATDINSCMNTVTVSVVVNSLPNVQGNTSATIICANSTFTLSGSGATTYTWSNGETDGAATTATTTTTYTVTGEDNNGCMNTGVVTVTVIALPDVQISATSTAVCMGSSETLTGMGATTYTWSNGIVDGTAFTPTATATYTLNGTDNNNCSNWDTLTVVVNDLPNVMASTSSTVVCAGTTATLTAMGADTYTWSTSDVGSTDVVMPTTNNLDYTVNATDVNGCMGMATISLSVDSIAIINYSVTATTCNSTCDGTADINFMGGVAPYTFNWISSTTQTYTTNVATNLCANAYNVIIEDANGCMGSLSGVIVPQPATINITNVVYTPTMCVGDNDTISGTITGGTPPYTPSIQPSADIVGNTSNGIVVSPAATTVYTVSVTDNNGCMMVPDYTLQIDVNNCSSGIAKNNNKNQFEIYPNPATNQLTIQGVTELGTITIYNAIGEIIEVIQSKDTVVKIDVSQYASGIYTVFAHGSYQKIIKQ